MASNGDEMERSSSKAELKYLGFVRAIAAKMVLWLSYVYDYAKQSGATVESAVISVYHQFNDVIDDILASADKKVDDATKKFDERAPPLAKQLLSTTQSVAQKTISSANQLLSTTRSVGNQLLSTTQSVGNQVLSTTQSMVKGAPLVGTTQSMIQNAPDLANQLLSTTQSMAQGVPLVGDTIQKGSQIGLDLINQVQAVGMNAALSSTLAVLKLVVLTQLATFWCAANKYTLFNAVAQVALPIATYKSEIYNNVVAKLAVKSTVFSYLPLIPIEEMASAYKMVKAADDVLTVVAGGDN